MRTRLKKRVCHAVGNQWTDRGRGVSSISSDGPLRPPPPVVSRLQPVRCVSAGNSCKSSAKMGLPQASCNTLHRAPCDSSQKINILLPQPPSNAC